MHRLAYLELPTSESMHAQNFSEGKAATPEVAKRKA